MPVPFERKNKKTGEVTTTMYETVAERLTKFHEEHPEKKSVLTEVIQFKEVVVMKAVVKIDEDVFVGHAMETIGDSFINKSSALENCETSAIGRALASAGYLGSEFCSADELAIALKQQNTPPKVKKQDLSGSDWRDEKEGYKAPKKKDLTWRKASGEDLIWIIESGPDSWKQKATEEMNLRAKDVEEGVEEKTPEPVSKQETDDLFS